MKKLLGDPVSTVSRTVAPDETHQATPTRQILVIAMPFPSKASPTRGIFVKERIRAMATLPGYDVRVIAPVPWAPPIKSLPRWYEWRSYPHEEVFEGLRIYHPRYPFPPKIGGYLHAALMFKPVCRLIDNLREEFDFQLIDSHFVYPNGVLGAMLGNHYDVPVAMTGRGDDMLRFPGLPIVGTAIKKTVAGPHHFIALSNEIARSFERNGACPDRITIIPNGVDLEKFAPQPTHEVRRKLGLGARDRIILSVGDMQERKGFHILVDAFARIKDRYPNLKLYIIGGSAPYGKSNRDEVEKRISDTAMTEHVKLLGKVPHAQLSSWYSAADLFAFLASREGSPNVLLEALACGTPAVATVAGGIPEELADPSLGILVKNRNAADAAEALASALDRKWDRNAIREKMLGRSWVATAQQVDKVIRRAIENGASQDPRARNVG